MTPGDIFLFVYLSGYFFGIMILVFVQWIFAEKRYNDAVLFIVEQKKHQQFSEWLLERKKRRNFARNILGDLR